MANVGVILSGCGVFDGSEIHEAVCLLLALDQAGARYQCLAPNKPAAHVVNHLTQKPDSGQRNVLEESARIARGNVKDLAKVKGTDFDALLLPGGYGAAKNLCDFAFTGESCQVDPEVERVLTEAHAAKRPIGFVCIAPVIAAKLFGPTIHPTLTIGEDQATADKISAMGAQHESCAANAIVADEAQRIVTCPCYMNAQSISEIYAGAQKVVAKLLQWTSASQ